MDDRLGENVMAQRFSITKILNILKIKGGIYKNIGLMLKNSSMGNGIENFTDKSLQGNIILFYL